MKYDIFFTDNIFNKKVTYERKVDTIVCPVVEYLREKREKELEYEKIDLMHTYDGTNTKCPRKL